MRAEEFETLRPAELAEVAEERGMVQFPGESRRDFCRRLAAYDDTIGVARNVVTRGIKGGGK